MRIVFFGATELGYLCCEKLLSEGHNVCGIFTIQQEFKISYSPNSPVKNVLFRDFSVLGKQYNIPVVTIDGNLKSHVSDLEKMKPDFLLVAGWYYMIPQAMLDMASKGAAGLHASLLPKYRGNAPLVWAMINGEKETGVSFFYFSDGVDEGDIIDQEKFSIEETDTIKEVLEKATEASVDLVVKNIPLIAAGTAPRIKQDHSKATLFPKRSPEDGLIDWSWDAKRIKNFIRAQTKPYPGAFTMIGNKKIIIWGTDIIENP